MTTISGPPYGPHPSFDRERAFTYHAPHGTQAMRFDYLRQWAHRFADSVEAFCPASPERTLALRKIQEAVMWANASIAINEAEEQPPERTAKE